MRACMHVHIYICAYAYMRICMCVCVHVCVYACMHAWSCGRVRVHVCMYVCVHVCMYACSQVMQVTQVQSGHVSHTRCSQVKSCESARVSAETVSGGSVVAIGVDGKDGIVVRKDGYAKRCRGLNYVMIVSPQIYTRGSALSYFRL